MALLSVKESDPCHAESFCVLHDGSQENLVEELLRNRSVSGKRTVHGEKYVLTQLTLGSD